ncbi:MAG: precorrin-2 C(20)-methyltransferase [Candidatus Omnitrophota bacterium]|nr:precorrin-2 C(20)-methyltransferase [Candidatus Omnitrophota bacterium]
MSYKVQVIGVGPGTLEYLLPIAKRKIEEADCLIGSKRHIGMFSNLAKEEVVLNGHFDQALSFIKKYKDKKKIAVLVSGDPGIYSFSEKLLARLEKNEYTVVPGISVVQLAFARIGQSWSDAKIISLHGRKIENFADKVRPYPKVFLLTDASFSPDKIAAYLLKEGIENRRAVVLENLSYPNERIFDTDLKHLAKKKAFGLCVMIIEAKLKKSPKLYGVGLGPGDPKLVTLKAKEILDRADIIFTPKGSEDGSSLARAIVEAVTETPKNFIELTFPMTTDKTILNKYWMNASRKIAHQIHKGKEVVFVTIGDPFIYSTYAYLLKTLKRNFKGIDVETIPGISAFNAAACRLQFPLVEGGQKMAVVPVTGNLESVRRALVEFDTVVLMKVGAKLDKVVCLLKELELVKRAVLISRVGHKDEKIIRNLALLKDKKAGYLSVILVRKDYLG